MRSRMRQYGGSSRLARGDAMTLLALVDALQRQAVDQVAFYPRETLRRAIDGGDVEVAFENGEPCGYLWHGPYRPGRDAVIYQAVIHYDLRRRRHGAELVARIERDARIVGCAAVRCRCRSDIDANDFWRSLGFSPIAVLPGGHRRAAEINVWRRPIRAGLWDELEVVPSTTPADRRAYDRSWRANR